MRANEFTRHITEAGNKPLEKSYFGTGDTRSPRDIKAQMKGASDKYVQSTADKDTGPIHSRVAKMQSKMAKSELRKRSDHDRLATGTNESSLDEFASGGDFKPPMPPKNKGNDPFGNDDRSKIVQAVRQLLKAGNKVDWKVPGQMGHVVRADDHGVIMKRWNKPYSKINYSLHLSDDQDDQYQILMVKPGYYKVVSTDTSWDLEEQGVEESRKANTASARAELSKREKRADPTMDAKKKSEQDAAWERLQAHMNKPENMDVLKRLATKEGVAETMPMRDAVKVLKHYGAEHFKTTSNELHFYKNGRPFSVDLIWNDDTTRSVSLRSLNSATRGLKGQGVAEGLNEFAPPGSNDSGNDGFSEETLKRLAAQWYNGDEDPRVERTLMAAGWEIGQDEGYDDEPGVFVVQAGDINGNSYISWPAHELKQGVAEGEVIQFPKKHKSDLDSFDDCPKCGRDLMGGTYMGHRVKVCNPCKQVYLPPNSGIDQKGNKIDEYGDTPKGQKMLTKVQKRATDRVTSKKADTDPKYAKKNQDTANAAWERMSDKDLEEQFCDDCGGSLAEHGKASRALCISSRPDSDLGASNLASCKSQGLRARDGKKSHKLGKGPESRVKVGGHKIKGHKYGGPLPDWS